MFNSVNFYFKGESKFITTPHPTVLLANHVSEEDIVALSHAFKYIKENNKFCFAMRQDIIESDFLTKEFEPKGFLKLILWFIDKTYIIKILLVYMGGIGVKRAFRDDARKLLKKGQLRDIVDSQWDLLAEGVLNGRNLFLFPEGKFSESGNLESIKRGTYLIFKRIPNVSYSYFNFTYDYISHKKPCLHIGFGENSPFPVNGDEYELAADIKFKLGNTYVLTPGNIFSYILYQKDITEGIEEKIINKKMANFIAKIIILNKYLISEELMSPNLIPSFENFILKAVRKGFLQKDLEGKITASEKLALNKFRNGKDMVRKNPYLYHNNQLKYYFNELNKLYSEV